MVKAVRDKKNWIQFSSTHLPLYLHHLSWWKGIHLQALGIVRVYDLASIRRSTSSGTTPSDTTALSPVSSASASAWVTICRRRGGSRARGARRRRRGCTSLAHGNVSRTAAAVSLGRHNLISGVAKWVVRHALRLVVIVVVCRCHSAGRTLVLTDGPILEVIIATVNQADFVLAPIAVKSALARTARARIVGAVVLENLSWIRLLSHIIFAST